MLDLAGPGDRPTPDSFLYGDYLERIVARWPVKTLGEVKVAREETRAAMLGGTVNLGEPVMVTSMWVARLDRLLCRKIMELLAALRAKRLPEIDATAGDPAKRVTLEQSLRTDSKPYLDELLNSKDPNRFEHPKPEVQDQLLAALQSQAVGAAEGELAAQATEGKAGPEGRARAAGGLPTGAWCGAFAYAQLKSSGLDPRWRVHALSTGPSQGWDRLFDYEDDFWIWTGQEWKPVKQYHATDRGSVRSFTKLPDTVTAASLAGSVRPGDLVLIDNAAGKYADHITMCRSFDPATGTLQTIGGNEPDIKIDTWDVNKNPAAYDAGKNPDGTKVMKGARTRIYAVGRLSVVDFETRHYADKKPADLTKAP